MKGGIFRHAREINQWSGKYYVLVEGKNVDVPGQGWYEVSFPLLHPPTRVGFERPKKSEVCNNSRGKVEKKE